MPSLSLLGGLYRKDGNNAFVAGYLCISSADIERTEFQILAAFKTSPPESSRGDNQMAQAVDLLNRERQ